MRLAAKIAAVVSAVFLLLVLAPVVHAQTASASAGLTGLPIGDPYVFGSGGVGFAPNGVRTVGRIHLGAGADIHVHGMFALEPEAGWVSSPTRLGCCSFGLASANVAYHAVFMGVNRWVPFVTSGYAVAFNWGTGANLFNIGGGFNFWASDRWAWRLEFRTYQGAKATGGTPRFSEVRAGICF